MKKFLIFLLPAFFIILSFNQSGASVRDENITLVEAIGIATDEVPGIVIGAEWCSGYIEIKLGGGVGGLERVYLNPEGGPMMGIHNIRPAVYNQGSQSNVSMNFVKGLFKVRVLTDDGISSVVYVDAESGKVVGADR